MVVSWWTGRATSIWYCVIVENRILHAIECLRVDPTLTKGFGQ